MLPWSACVTNQRYILVLTCRCMQIKAIPASSIPPGECGLAKRRAQSWVHNAVQTRLGFVWWFVRIFSERRYDLNLERQREKKSDQFKFKCRKMVNHYAIRSKMASQKKRSYLPSGSSGRFVCLPKRVLFFECFPYVCPEPVLVKR